MAGCDAGRLSEGRVTEAYPGRYPCGSLMHEGIWYYGTYLLGPDGSVPHDDGLSYNWPILGPFMGFRISEDRGLTWRESPCTPDSPLFPEPQDRYTAR